MAEADQLLGMYLHLARASHLRRQPMVRVKLLVLAGVQAESMGLEEIAALCRHKILAQNGRHLVRRWPTISEALSAEPFQAYLKQLRRRYSIEKIEHMVQSLGIEMGQERKAYFSDQEYAAALLDTRVEAIADILAQTHVRTASPRKGKPRGTEPPRTVPRDTVPRDTVPRDTVPRDTVPRAERDRPQPLEARRLTNLLVVWAPFVVGLIALGALAVASRTIGR